MEIGFVGLGRMGGNMVTRLLSGGHQVVGYDRSPDAVRALATGGARGATSLAELVRLLAPPRTVWVMVPAGEATETTVAELGGLLERGDLVVDGGNARWTDDARRAAALAARGIHYADAGVSGGVWGLAEGYCIMVGGSPEAVEALRPALTTLAPPEGWLHVGPVGAGHYVKMVHNGIEYGMMQAYAEGFELMAESEHGLDLGAIAKLWTRGSVVRSWLLELTADVLGADPKLEGLKPWVEDSGEGRWTVEEAVSKRVPLPVITAALFARFRSRRENSYADRLLAALRHAFGGHAVRR
jgi:6-phosphogluconate dehydrogenase